jgi:alkanesulfonate monooxygenase SsuD/methylene tetrahydromethanopterin reductase-like flavin-dependent oxidoreductase (luciferase family)/predicted kinase
MSREPAAGARVPDPALVVLVGPSGSGKSTWAAEHYRTVEVVCADTLRAVVGSGPHDLGASDDAFAVLEQVVRARLSRSLTTVVDTLGSDEGRRRAWRALAREAGLPAVLVVLGTPPEECRRRNTDRDHPVPAGVLGAQLRRHRAFTDALDRDGDQEGWDVVVRLTGERSESDVRPAPDPRVPDRPQADVGGLGARRSSQGLRVVLQLSRFPWGEDPRSWLRDVALAADAAGLSGIALMDHLIQIPQVDRAWAPIPEPWVTLGLLAGLGTDLSLGTLVTPVTFRAPGITAKAAATLDALSGGRAFVGVGAGWWQREHEAYGLDFPAPGERLDALERGIETMRALWAAGTREHTGPLVQLPETTCYPRPTGPLPVVVGGSGPRSLRIAATRGDAVNVPSALPRLDEHLATVRAHDPDVLVTVLDLPTVGHDRDDVWARVERLRGRTAASTYAARTHAGTPAEQRERYGRLAERGVDTVFVALADLTGPDDLERLAPLMR